MKRVLMILVVCSCFALVASAGEATPAEPPAAPADETAPESTLDQRDSSTTELVADPFLEEGLFTTVAGNCKPCLTQFQCEEPDEFFGTVCAQKPNGKLCRCQVCGGLPGCYEGLRRRPPIE